jgi:hypothetical protein
MLSRNEPPQPCERKPHRVSLAGDDPRNQLPHPLQEGTKGEGKHFGSADEVILAVDAKAVAYNALCKIKMNESGSRPPREG